MKNLTTAIFIALFVLGSLPVFAKENTNHAFKHFGNRRHVDILIVGDGGMFLICV